MHTPLEAMSGRARRTAAAAAARGATTTRAATRNEKVSKPSVVPLPCKLPPSPSLFSWAPASLGKAESSRLSLS